MRILKFVYLMFFLLLGTSTTLVAATSWDVSSDGRSASITTSPYENTYTTTTLSILGATALQVTISGETKDGYDFLYITDSAGNTQVFDGYINTSYTVSGDNITIRFVSYFSITRSGVTVDISAITPNDICPGNTISNLDGTDVTATDSANGVTVSGWTTYYYHFTPSASGTIQVNSSANKTFNSLFIQKGCGSTPLWSSTVNSRDKSSPEIEVNAGDKIVIAFYCRYSADISVDLDFTYTVPIADAIDDNYQTPPNVQLSVDATTGLLANDQGAGVTITDINTSNLQGTIDSYDANTGSFTFTPLAGFTGLTSFSYTITDSSGNTDSATVQISVALETDFDSNQEFTLINPENTRNIIGDYKIAGNTVLCLTTKETTFATSESECVDTTDMEVDATSNNYIAKFIDIDNDSSTWNSSSSYITLPNSYKQVLWAGLFWQGRFANSAADIHYGTPAGSSFSWIDTGDMDDDEFDESFLGNGPRVQNILLKTNTGSYQPVQATKVYYNHFGGGITYSARADVTYLLRQASMAAGDKVTFTIGNLPTSEGREYNPGIFGGWSLLVIYAEDIIVGKPRSIAVHGGMLTVNGSVDDQFIDITGFKLPSSGNTASASLSIFSGEGEFDYAPDGIQINSNTDSTWRDMPEASDQDNIFDAKMDGIDRDDISGHMNNLQNNNVGVEVDNFDLSSIVSGYSREDTDLLRLRMYSDQDYIIPGMLVFKTELYQPIICYDYTLEAGGVVIQSEYNEINTSIGAYTTDSLITRISIQSKEGDFNFNDVNLTYALEDTTNIEYIPGTTMIADDGENFYRASMQTTDESNEGFLIYLGDGASVNQGGVIEPYQKRFIR